MKIETKFILMSFLALAVGFLALTGCGGGGGSSSPVAETPIDEGSDGGGGGEVIALDSKTATKALAGVLNASIMNAFGITAPAASVSKAMPPEIAGLCTEVFAFSYDCPGGGAIVGAGSCEPVELGGCAVLLTLVMEFQNCVGDESFTVDGDFDVNMRLGLLGCDVGGGVLNKWYAQSQTGIVVADGASDAVSITRMIVNVAIDGSVDLSSHTQVAGDIYGCAVSEGELVCALGDPENVTDLCDGALACVVDADCPVEDEGGTPYFCDRGCCTAYDAPEKYTCTGMRECSDNFDCYRPDIHLYCEDGVCQPPCLDDSVCRKGATCLTSLSNGSMFQDLFATGVYESYHSCVCVNDVPIPPPPPPGP